MECPWFPICVTTPVDFAVFDRSRASYTEYVSGFCT
jgi:hypothetical protein